MTSRILRRLAPALFAMLGACSNAMDDGSLELPDDGKTDGSGSSAQRLRCVESNWALNVVDSEEYDGEMVASIQGEAARYLIAQSRTTTSDGTVTVDKAFPGQVQVVDASTLRIREFRVQSDGSLGTSGPAGATIRRNADGSYTLRIVGQQMRGSRHLITYVVGEWTFRGCATGMQQAQGLTCDEANFGIAVSRRPNSDWEHLAIVRGEAAAFLIAQSRQTTTEAGVTVDKRFPGQVSVLADGTLQIRELRVNDQGGYSTSGPAGATLVRNADGSFTLRIVGEQMRSSRHLIRYVVGDWTFRGCNR